MDLDFANPDVLLEMIRVLRLYVRRGIRSFRLDAVVFVWKQSGTTCLHQHQTHELIKLIRLLLENMDPSTVVVTETNVPNRENLSYFGNISSQPQKLSLAEMNLIATEKWRDLLSGQRYDDLDAEVIRPPTPRSGSPIIEFFYRVQE